MGGVDSIGGDADALQVSDFSGGTLLNGDVVTIGDGEIERRDRRRNYRCAAIADTACLMRSATAVGCDT